MYSVGGSERVIPLDVELPDMDTGAPMPVAASTEHTTILGYFTAPAVSDEGLTNEVAVVKFSFCHATLLGAPNDEAFHGHPLAAVGLQPYSFSEVLNSPWIAALEEMNRVHPHHSAEPFAALRHFILSFHDTTFECVARKVELLGLRVGQTREVVGHAVQHTAAESDLSS